MMTAALTSPGFWAFDAAIGWFLGLLIVATKSIEGIFGFSVIAFSLAQIPRFSFRGPSSTNGSMRLGLHE